MRHVYLLLLIFLFLPHAPCFAQNGEDTAGVVVHADPRLAILLKKRDAGSHPRAIIRSGRGYRVQIYNGPDRVRANQVRVDFLRRYPSVKTYMSYNSPNYRLKVGDFQGRPEAQRLWQQIKNLFNPSMIVPDIIEINTLRND